MVCPFCQRTNWHPGDDISMECKYCGVEGCRCTEQHMKICPDKPKAQPTFSFDARSIKVKQ